LTDARIFDAANGGSVIKNLYSQPLFRVFLKDLCDQILDHKDDEHTRQKERPTP
jgi:hypothetical protein